ncbi:hypothetical protein, conserved [Eimeria brunetti]|uniref:Uncharacterized protein n=1 Tax=Eimeria brunetti TaxID=51314 RepID=U6L9H1_9EIME|nr:hypothetical protein, conserved [Eimeria brunetti]
MLKASNAEARVEFGRIGQLNLLYTPLPGIVTLQLKDVDIRIRPNFAGFALRKLTETLQELGEIGAFEERPGLCVVSPPDGEACMLSNACIPPKYVGPSSVSSYQQPVQGEWLAQGPAAAAAAAASAAAAAAAAAREAADDCWARVWGEDSLLSPCLSLLSPTQQQEEQICGVGDGTTRLCCSTRHPAAAAAAAEEAFTFDRLKKIQLPSLSLDAAAAAQRLLSPRRPCPTSLASASSSQQEASATQRLLHAPVSVQRETNRFLSVPLQQQHQRQQQLQQQQQQLFPPHRLSHPVGPSKASCGVYTQRSPHTQTHLLPASPIIPASSTSNSLLQQQQKLQQPDQQHRYWLSMGPSERSTGVFTPQQSLTPAPLIIPYTPAAPRQFTAPTAGAAAASCSSGSSTRAAAAARFNTALLHPARVSGEPQPGSIYALPSQQLQHPLQHPQLQQRQQQQ